MLLGCAPELADIKERKGPPGPEVHEIYPVAGYEPMAGMWQTVRRDDVLGEQRLPLIIEVHKDVLSGSAPDHALRMRCQASHRTCTGTWSDNVGSGKLILTFDPEFKSFTGSYEGRSKGQELGRTEWTGQRSGG